MKLTSFLISVILLLLTFHSSTHGQTISENYNKIWADPEIEDRIQTGIDTYRKGWAALSFKNEKGKPVTFSGDIRVEQKSHDFLFGANIFMIDGYEEDMKNEKYEAVFQDLLNFATVPFYWPHLEPERGNVRFEKDSKPMHRRPAPDIVVDFCKKNDVVMKGHPLFWDNTGHGIPKWLPTEEDSIEYFIEKRIKQIAERYSDDIWHWDVVNETNNRRVENPVPKQFAFKVFKIAEKHFGYEHTFAYNFTTRIWQEYREEYSLEYVLVENMLLKGGRVDAIGLQCHFFNPGIWNKILEGNAMTPEKMYQILDLYGQFDRPLQITEITFPTYPKGKTGEENQARITRDFYRLWFSHPNVKAITWWNIPDGGAAGNQNRSDGGFLREDMSPKPSYQVLDELINKEWQTQITETVNGKDKYKFKGFYGEYNIVLTKDGSELKRINVHIDEDGGNAFDIVLPKL
jgi:GH35 family endo-1,4-beta-xylanase